RELRGGPRDAAVEQPPLLGDLPGRAHGRLARQLLLLDPRQEDGVELEPLRAVEREQVDASLGAVVEARLQPFDPLLDRLRAVVELLGQLAEAREIGLPHELALAEAVRHRLDEALLLRQPPYLPRQR